MPTNKLCRHLRKIGVGFPTGGSHKALKLFIVKLLLPHSVLPIVALLEPGLLKGVCACKAGTKSPPSALRHATHGRHVLRAPL